MQTIPFEFDSKYGVFRDALHLSDEEFAQLTEADIIAMKQQRYDNWLAIVENPDPVVEEPAQGE